MQNNLTFLQTKLAGTKISTADFEMMGEYIDAIENAYSKYPVFVTQAMDNFRKYFSDKIITDEANRKECLRLFLVMRDEAGLYERRFEEAFKAGSLPVNPLPFLDYLMVRTRSEGTDWFKSDNAKAVMWALNAMCHGQLATIDMHNEYNRLDKIIK